MSYGMSIPQRFCSILGVDSVMPLELQGIQPCPRPGYSRHFTLEGATVLRSPTKLQKLASRTRAGWVETDLTCNHFNVTLTNGVVNTIDKGREGANNKKVGHIVSPVGFPRK